MQTMPIVLNENQKDQIKSINVITMNELISNAQSRPQSTLEFPKSKIKISTSSKISN